MTTKQIAQKIVDCFNRRGHVWVLGNGGSLADASHWAAEFRNLGSVIVFNDIAKLSSIINDDSFVYCFWQQVKDNANPGDIVIGISSSGRSHNVLVALIAARQMGVETIDWPRKYVPENPMEVADVQERQYEQMHSVYLQVKKAYVHG